MGNQIVNRLGQNLRHPTNNFWGRIVKNAIFLRKNVPLETLAVELCNIQPHHHILEVGFGPGLGLKEAAKLVQDGSGKVYGLELSLAMMNDAGRRLATEIGQQKVDLTQGSVTLLPYSNDHFDRVFHVNCFYFWDNMPLACSELYRVMKPHSFVVTTGDPQRVSLGVSRGMFRGANPDPIRYMQTLEQSGFENVRAEYYKDGKVQAILAEVREKKRPVHVEEKDS